MTSFSANRAVWFAYRCRWASYRTAPTVFFGEFSHGAPLISIVLENDLFERVRRLRKQFAEIALYVPVNNSTPTVVPCEYINNIVK